MEKSMDSLKFNKVFAGVLLAALLLMAGVKFGQIMVPSHDGHGGHGAEHVNAYPIEVAEVAASGEVAAPAGPEPILALLARFARFFHHSPSLLKSVPKLIAHFVIFLHNFTNFHSIRVFSSEMSARDNEDNFQ